MVIEVDAVLTQFLAVVAKNKNCCLFLDTQLIKRPQQLLNSIVHTPHLGIVLAAHKFDIGYLCTRRIRPLGRHPPEPAGRPPRPQGPPVKVVEAAPVFNRRIAGIEEVSIPAGRHVGRVRVPIVYKEKKRFAAAGFQPLNGKLVKPKTIRIRTRLPWIQTDIESSGKPGFVMRRQIVHGRRGVPGPLQVFRKERRALTQRPAAPMRHNPMRGRQLSGEHGRKRGLRGNRRRIAILEHRRVACKGIDKRSGWPVITVASESISSQAVDGNHQEFHPHAFTEHPHGRCHPGGYLSFRQRFLHPAPPNPRISTFQTDARPSGKAKR